MNTTLRSVITASIVLLSIPASASNAGPVRFGIKAGLAVANVDPSEIFPGVDLKTKKGPGGGAFVTWGLSEHFGLQGELLYVSKGLSFGKSEETDEYGNSIGTLEILQVMDYLEIPLLLRAAWFTERPVSPAVVVGPAVSFKVRERFKTTGAREGSVKTDAFASSDFGVAAGGELRFRTGPRWSVIEARYTIGLVDAVERFYTRKEKNRALTLMAGYAF